MPRISVICAPPPAPNPGMASVDLAFHALCHRQGIRADVRHCLLYDLPEALRGRPSDEVERLLKMQTLPFEYTCFRDRLDEVYDSDAIVFWGDFLHALDYHEGIRQMMVKFGVARDEAEAARQAYRHLFLTDADDAVLNKAMVFGGTILFNLTRDYLDETYTDNLRRLMRGCRRVWMREVYSALSVGHLRDDYRASHLGTDCSMLLRPEDLRGLPRTDWSGDHAPTRGKVGVFFGRSALDGKLMGKFAREVCRKLGREAQWLPWGEQSAFDDHFKRVRRGFPDMQVRACEGSPLMGDLYALLSGYDMVISDTYHVCVNAWRMGVPAVCVGQAVSKAARSISSGKAYAWRDKRQVFFSMYDAMPYYVYGEEIADRTWRDRRVWQLSQLLAERRTADMIIARMHHHRDQVEADLAGELKRLVGPASLAPGSAGGSSAGGDSRESRGHNQPSATPGGAGG